MAIKYHLLIFLIAMVPIASAEIDNYDNYSVLGIYTELSSSAYTIETGASPRIDEFEVSLTFLPRAGGDRQMMASREFSTAPNAETDEAADHITFAWKDPAEGQYFYSVNARLETVNKLSKIRGKAEYPIQKVPPEAARYLAPTEFIDSNMEIREKASEIIAGETDYYRIMHKLAVWVEQNIRYDLTTITADAVQKSSWVLENKEGVCDELTNLYISFLRSAGMPARFVGGQVYSNIGHKFGNHGWAEVYYPGEGWIPVDVTFGQIGWIGPTHIKFKDSADSGEPSAQYKWKANDVDFKMNPIVIKTAITKAEGEAEKHVGMAVVPMKKVVGPGSYVPVIVTISNPNDYYAPALLYVTKAPGVSGKNKQSLLLAPLEEAEAYFIIKIPENASKGFIYTTAIEVRTAFGSAAQAEIKFEDGAEKTSREWAEEQASRLGLTSGKEFLPNIQLGCAFEKPHYYESETAMLQCSVRNIGNAPIGQVKACHFRECHNIYLGVQESKAVSFEVPLRGFKDERALVTAETKNMARKAYASIDIIGVPDISIEAFGPLSVKYGDDSQFSFLLNSTAPVRGLNINIIGFGHSTIEKFDTAYEAKVPFNSREFMRGKVDIAMTYHDAAGKEYSKDFSYGIEVTGKPWHIRFLLWIEGFLD